MNGSNENHAELEVTRRRRFYLGALGPRWVVFLDGVWIGNAPRGKTARFSATPGTHKVTVWARGGGTCSNDLELEFQAGKTYRLTCDVNVDRWRSLFARQGPISRMQNQVGTVVRIAQDGWINKGGIVLTEI